MEFRRLKPNEIECRVKQKSKTGALMLLLYKNARSDMAILDETVGAEYWQRSHSRDNANCTVSIFNKELNQWVSKEDTGIESNTEKEKGLASDSFKRACVNWGIGRELYTAPSIWIKSGDYKPGGTSTYDRFTVSDIGYDKDGCISRLKIVNASTSKQVFVWESGQPEAVPDESKIPGYPPRDEMIEVVNAHYPVGTDSLTALLNSFGIESLDQASDAQIAAVYNKYKK